MPGVFKRIYPGLACHFRGDDSSFLFLNCREQQRPSIAYVLEQMNIQKVEVLSLPPIIRESITTITKLIEAVTHP